MVRVLASRYLLYCLMSKACGFYLKVLVSLEKADILSVCTMPATLHSLTLLSLFFSWFCSTYCSPLLYTWRKAVTGSHECHAVMKFSPQNKSVCSFRIQPHSKLQDTGRTQSNSILEYNDWPSVQFSLSPCLGLKLHVLTSYPRFLAGVCPP